MLAGEEAFAKVTADDLFGVTDGGKVGAGIPFEQEVEINGEPGDYVLRRRKGEIGRQEVGDLGFR